MKKSHIIYYSDVETLVLSQFLLFLLFVLLLLLLSCKLKTQGEVKKNKIVLSYKNNLLKHTPRQHLRYDKQEETLLRAVSNG